MGMEVMALPISWVSSCCSRSCSLEGGPWNQYWIFLRKKQCGKEGEDRHGGIYVLHGHLAVDLLHGGASILHSDEGFLVDVCGFDGVDLLLEHGDLAVGLFEGVLVLLLSFEGVPCG